MHLFFFQVGSALTTTLAPHDLSTMAPIPAPTTTTVLRRAGTVIVSVAVAKGAKIAIRKNATMTLKIPLASSLNSMIMNIYQLSWAMMISTL